MQDTRYAAPTESETRDHKGPDTVMPFAGFEPPESNFWRLPNNWFDLSATFGSWSEHKVVEYILRHTWGYHEYGLVKLITMDEFMHGRKRKDGSRIDAGCRMAENSIKKGIADAVAHGFIIVRTDDSDRGRIKKYYAPRMRQPVADEGEHAHTPGGQSLTLQDQSLLLDPQALTPEARILTLPQQPVTLTTYALDPRTETTPLEIHQEQETSSKTEQVAGPSLISPAHETESGNGVQRKGGNARAAHRAPPSPQQGSPGAMPPPRADLVRRLEQEGVAPQSARRLVSTAPAERIERQLGWISRRSYRNRAATLVRAIEQDFAEPERGAPRITGSTDTRDGAEFFRGAYALCSACGSRPCIAGCPGPPWR